MAAIDCWGGDFGEDAMTIGEHVEVFAMPLKVQIFDLACAFECDADAHDVADGSDRISYEDGVAVDLDLQVMIGFGAFDLLPL